MSVLGRGRSSRGATISALCSLIALLGIIFVGTEILAPRPFVQSQTAQAAAPISFSSAPNSATVANLSGGPATCAQAQLAALNNLAAPQVVSADKGKGVVLQACIGAVARNGSASSQTDDYVCTGRTGVLDLTYGGEAILTTKPDSSVPQGMCSLQICTQSAPPAPGAGGYYQCSVGKQFPSGAIIGAGTTVNAAVKAPSSAPSTKTAPAASATESDCAKDSSLAGCSAICYYDDHVQKWSSACGLGTASAPKGQTAGTCQSDGTNCSPGSACRDDAGTAGTWSHGVCVVKASTATCESNGVGCKDGSMCKTETNQPGTWNDGRCNAAVSGSIVCPAGKICNTAPTPIAPACLGPNCAGETPNPDANPDTNRNLLQASFQDSQVSGSTYSPTRSAPGFLSPFYYIRHLIGSLLGEQAPAPSEQAWQCATDQDEYAQQERYYQEAYQQYRYEYQQYQEQQQQARLTGGYTSSYSAPVLMQPPAPCYDNDNPSLCSSSPQTPDSAQCTAGVWKPVSGGDGCISNWLCIPDGHVRISSDNAQPAPAPVAQISCAPRIADRGTVLALSFSCENAFKSEGTGFDTDDRLTGAVSVFAIKPSPGTNTATYSLTCTNVLGMTSGAQCSVLVGDPLIALIGNTTTVASGDSATIGWITSGMRSCVVSSPDLPDFTAANAGFTTTSGVATTSSIAGATHFLLHCETLGGQSSEASTTINLK